MSLSLQRQYAVNGYCVLDDVVPDDVIPWWVRRAALAASRVDLPGRFEGRYRYGVLDDPATRETLAGLHDFYATLPDFLEGIVGREMILSPYDRSAVSVTVWSEPGDEMGWHFDTNAVTALLYLTDTPDGPTEMRDLQGHHASVACKAGRLLVMQGRNCYHRVAPRRSTALRVSAQLNLYHPGDTLRPDGVDDDIYGK